MASGFVNGDTARLLSGSLTRAAGENVGSYAILQGTLGTSANYTIAFTGSTLQHHAGPADGHGEPAVEGLWPGRSGADLHRNGL